MDHARCRTLSPTEFFPSDGVGVEVAKRVCAECPVKTACLEFAIATNQPYGIWGGANASERRSIRRRRQAQRRRQAS